MKYDARVLFSYLFAKCRGSSECWGNDEVDVDGEWVCIAVCFYRYVCRSTII